MRKHFKDISFVFFRLILVCAIAAVGAPAGAVFAEVDVHAGAGFTGEAESYAGAGFAGEAESAVFAGEAESAVFAGEAESYDDAGTDGEICTVKSYGELQSALEDAVQSAAGAENGTSISVSIQLTDDIIYSCSSSSDTDDVDAVSSATASKHSDSSSKALSSSHTDSGSNSQITSLEDFQSNSDSNSLPKSSTKTNSFSSLDIEMPAGSGNVCCIILDLNGHKLSVSAVSAETSLFFIGRGCSLAINDSVGGGSIISTLTCDTTASLFTIMKGGSLTVNDGTFKANQVKSSSCTILNQGGTATINGGTFEASYYGLNQERGHLKLNGGTFSATDTARGVDICISSNNGSFTINACTFSTLHIDGYGAASSIYISDHLSKNSTITKNGNPYALAPDASQLGTSKDTFVISSNLVQTDKPTFSDVPKGAWYAESLQKNVNSGLLSGYPDGTFKPNAKIKWCMLAQILYNITDENSLNKNNGAGISIWYQPVMDFARSNNLIPKSDNSDFAEDYPTRYQVIQSIYQLGLLTGAITDTSASTDSSTSASSDTSASTDASTDAGTNTSTTPSTTTSTTPSTTPSTNNGAYISATTRPTTGSSKNALTWAVENKILVGNQNGDLSLDRHITRAEMSEILYRINSLFASHNHIIES